MTFKLPRLCSFLIIFNFMLTFSVFSQTESSPEYPKDRVIVKFKNNISANAVNNIRVAMGVKMSRSLRLIGAEVWELSGPTADETITSLKNDPNVEYIEPDYRLYAVTPASALADSVQVFPNDPGFPDMWGLHNTGQSGGTPDADIDAPEAWSITTGKEIVVGVIDTGVDWLHEDLADNIWANPGEIPDNGIDDDNNGFVDDVRGWDFFANDNNPQDEAGHGTHVAGTIAAVGNNNIGTVGVSWAAKIMILRFLGPDGSGSTSDAISCIDYAVQMNAHLTNNSWGGGGFSQPLKDAIEAAGNAGQLFVASAGNTGENSDQIPSYPASYDLDNIISVANLTRFNQLSSTSTFGVVTVDLAAPGTSVLSTIPGNQYAFFSGTSMASPHVAGTVSLILSIDPALPPLDVKEMILSTVDSVAALQGLVGTGGRLNAHRALLLADPDSIPPAPVTDLQAGTPASNSIMVSWTASGDDSTEGTATAYDIRFSTDPIDSGNFNAAVQAQNLPTPQEAGTPESFTVKDLDFNTTYYFALKVIDNVGNASGISNVVTETTLGIPIISTAPTVLTENLPTGGVATQNFTISNVGEGTLDFIMPGFGGQASLKINSAAGDKLSFEFLPLNYNGIVQKPAVRQNGEHIKLSAGQSDSFPLLKRRLAALQQEQIVFFDDMESGINGWTTELYNNAKDDLWHQTMQSFNSATHSWWCAVESQGNYSTGARISNAAITPPIDLTKSQAPITLEFFENYSTETGFDFCMVDVSTDGGNTWIPLRGAIGMAPSGFSNGWVMTILDLSAFAEETIHIRFYFDTLDSFGNSFPGWLFDDVLVTATAQPFVTVNPASGTVLAGNSQDIEMTFNAAGLAGDTYEADIEIFSNDPITPVDSVKAILNVTDAADIVVSPDTVDFGNIFVNFPTTKVLKVTNEGTLDLNVTDITFDNSDFSADTTAFILAPNQLQEVSITLLTSTEGEITASMTIVNDDPSEPTKQVPLHAVGLVPPEITTSADSLNEQLFNGEMSQQSFTIANTGGSDLNFAIDIESVESGAATVLFRDLPSSGEKANRARSYLDAGVSLFQNNDSDISPDAASVVLPPDLVRPNAVSLPFRDGFEDGDFADWIIDNTIGEREVTTATAARGLYSFTYRNAIEGHFHGIHQEFDPSQPEYISFYIRSGSTTQSDAYFVITANGNTLNPAIFFFARGTGFFFANGTTPGGDESFPYNANQWYQIEFKEINWQEKHFDYYVDGSLIKANIPFRNPELVNDVDRVFLYNFTANAQGWWDDITIGDPGTLWLDANPLAGTVAANSQLGIDVFFDASGLIGDDYRANLVISSNDPATPKVTLPVLLQVTDAPDIALSKTRLDYGEVFTGVDNADTLIIFNAGTDTLKVTSISVDLSDVSIDPTSLDLPPEKQQSVIVILNTNAPGEIEATLTISSNDQDEAVVQVPLTATALIPPKIAVAPDSLSQALFTGGNATQKLTISNENADGDTLDFSISIVQKDSVASAFSVQYRISSMTDAKIAVKNDFSANSQNQPDRSWGEHPALQARTTGSQTTQQIYTTDNVTLPIVISDPVGDGGPVDVIALRAQSGMEIVEFQIDFSTDINPSDFGGALSLDIDQNPNTGLPPFSGLPGQDIGAEYEFFFFNLAFGFVELYDEISLIGSYPVEISEKSIRFEAPLADLGNDDGVMDVTGVLGLSSGPTDWFPDVGHGTIQKGVSWLVPSLFSGNVPGGASLEIEIIFDAAGLQGGDYFADIAISNNDPTSPLVNVPAHLMVTGAADISLSDSLLDFGEVFIDFSKLDSVIVSNDGTETLEVTNITSDNLDFTVDVSSLIIEPGESRTVHVTFAPKTETISSGVLVFSSNDPDEPALEVAVTGEGLLPPEISVSPNSFNFFVNPEDSTAAVLNITNEGGSPLKFALFDEEQQTAAQANDGNLFWTVSSNVASDTLYRSDIDGNDSQVIFLDTGLLGIAIDHQEKIVYWAHAGDGTIRASNFDGSNERTTVSGLITPVEIALDKANGKIYWTDFSASNIGRANLDGSDLEIIIAGSATTGSASKEEVWSNEAVDRGNEKPQQLINPWGIALDLVNQILYWTDQNADQIGRANLDGSNEEIIIDISDGLSGPRGIEADPAEGKIYFIDSFNSMIKRANLDGSQIETLITVLETENPLSFDLDRDAQKFYWTDNGSDRISRADYDGSNIETVVQTFVSGFAGPFGVAISAESGWLSEEPTQGLIAAGESAEIAIKVNTAGLEEGEYQATIFVESNDPDESRLEIPVLLSVNRAQVVLSTPNTLKAAPGDTLDVPISMVLLDSSLQISALGVALKATGGVLTFLGHTPGPILPGQTLSITNPSPDSVRMGFLALNQAPLAQSGLLVTLHFQVHDSASGGEHALFLSGVSASAPNGRAIPAASLNGKVTVITNSIAGTVLYCDPDGTGNPAKPVPDLDVELLLIGNTIQDAKTSQSGEYNLSNIRPGFDYRVEIGRQLGGTGSALTPTDALLVVQAFLGTTQFSACQNLAADADGNRTVNPVDAGLIFNRFLGKIARFPVADWRAYPSNYNINEPANAWENVPSGIDYPNLRQSLSEQDYQAVAIGDVDLSWPDATPSSSANLLAKGSESASLSLQVAETELSPITNEATVQIFLDGPALINGVFALGGELQFDATALEVLSVRWGEIMPKEGFQTDFRALAATQRVDNIENEAENLEAANGRLRFGGFSTSHAKINTAGVLVEIDVRLVGEHDPGTVLPLELAGCSAAFDSKNIASSGRNSGAVGTLVNFAVAQISVTGGAVAVSALPKSFALEENYPNPFNPTTRIRYQLPEASKVKIVIYNALGHKILTLMDSGAQKAGFYALDWNGRDDSGRAVASGVYLYRIEAISASQSFTKTRKMLLLK